MLKASDIMTSDVVVVSPDTPVSQAAQILLQHRFNGLPVVEGGAVVGILCQADLVAQHKKLSLPSLFTVLDGFVPMTSMDDVDAQMRKMSALTVAQAMTPAPVTVEPATPLDEVATIMVDRGLHTLPVVEGGKLVGVIGMEDVLRTLSPKN